MLPCAMGWRRPTESRSKHSRLPLYPPSFSQSTLQSIRSLRAKTAV